MQVERDQVLRMAKLARLELTPEELQRMTGSMNQLMEYMAVLKQLDLKDVKPMLAVDASERPLREDIPVPGLDKEMVFRSAPEVNMDHFSIPKVIG